MGNDTVGKAIAFKFRDSLFESCLSIISFFTYLIDR